MATTKKNHYYVLVMTAEGPKFVTKLGEGHTAYWEDEGTPLELSKVWAEDMIRGLTWNGFVAFVVNQPWKIESQPYRYAEGHLAWKRNEEVEECSES